jgi:predicted ATPase/DNA-binding winged helix-turn-helix (wHTH) protein
VPIQGSLVYECGPWEVDLGRRELRSGGVPVPIGGRAFEIMEAMVQSAGELVTKDKLMDRVWPGAIIEENTLHVHMSAVRKALGPDRGMLNTVSGRGYRLLGSWTIRPESAPAEPAVLDPVRSSVQPLTTNLPAATSDLIGRSAAVQELQDLLSAYRVVTLTGPGGIGKTALMLAAARGMLPIFGGDGWLVELASLLDPGLVPSAVAGVLGLKLVGDQISSESVARAIGSQKLLLILDNCEHLIDAAAKLAEIVVRQCPGTTVLATSREVLRIDGEYVYRVPPLNVPPEQGVEPSDVLKHAAVQLLLVRARALGADFVPDGENLGAIAAICRRLDGIPLAIEFAAARVATLGAPQVAAMLDNRFGLLTGGRRTALPRHQTLRAALDWSYDLLPPTEAAALRRLAVFAGDFSLNAAMAAAGDLGPAPIVDHIAELVAKSLIVADFRGEVAQYRLLDTTRLYALEKLRGGAEHRDVARRHAEYYRALFAQAETESESRPQAEWLALYGRHIDNVRAGLDWAFSADGDPQLGVALTVAVVPLWVQLSLLVECRERVGRALASLDATEAATARPRMQLSAALGWSLMYGLGRAREAGPAWRTTLELADRLDDRNYRLRALWGLCIDQFNNGEFRRALDFARRFARLAANSADAVDLVMADRILATAIHYLGDQASARQHVDRVVAHLASVARQPQIFRYGFDQRVSTHYFQARILWLQGYADQASRVVEQNIAEARAVGHALTFCSVLGQGACPIAFLAGELDAAARYGAMLIEHTERHPVRVWNLWARCFSGMVLAKRGNLAAGLEILRSGLEQAGEAKFLPRFLLLLGELAACLGAAGEVASGLAAVDETLARCEARSERWYLPELLRIKGELLLLETGGRSLLAAEQCFDAGLALARRQGAMFWELRNAMSLARLRMRQDRAADGVEVLAPVYDKFTEGFETADLRAARALLRAPPPRR